MSSHQAYETLYGVGLLDDLHNYFPAILYEPDSFHSVPLLLRYVQQQTRTRFDLFSLGQREYQGAVSPPGPPPSTVPSVRLNGSALDVSANALPPNSILTPPRNHQPQQVPPAPTRQVLRNRLSGFSNEPPIIQYMFDLSDQEDDTQLTSRLLLSLLAAPLARRTGGLDAFLQPIEVRPTAEQIAAHTTIGNLVSDEDHPCAICQDTLAPDQEGRKLNSCGHWFHKTCIDTWFERNVHCPVCRHDIREAETTTTNTNTNTTTG